MDVEAVTPRAPRPVGRTVFTQTWADLSFLHWAVEPERIRRYLPPDVRPDVIDGVSYVGLVPFRMRGIGAWGSPGLPYFGSFLETNVRLYSVDGQGRRGVVFVSLDAARLAPVLAARWGPGLPYLWSRMSCRRQGDLIEYRCRRRWPGPRGATSRIQVRIGDPIEPNPLEHFLSARWGLHLSTGGASTGGREDQGADRTTGRTATSSGRCARPPPSSWTTSCWLRPALVIWPTGCRTACSSRPGCTRSSDRDGRPEFQELIFGNG